MKIKNFPLNNPNDLEEAIRSLLEYATDSSNGMTAHDVCVVAQAAVSKHAKKRGC